MYVFMQPKSVKVLSQVTQAASAKKAMTGKRFLDMLMAALSGWAV